MDIFRKPDLHAPRHRYKFKETITNDLIRRFKDKYPLYKDYSNDILMKAIKKHNSMIYKAVAHNRDGIELAQGLGNIFVGMAADVKKKPIAYKESLALGMKVYHKNWETDNQVAKIVYTSYTSRYKFEHRKIWYFSPVRQFSRYVSTICPSMWMQYVSLKSRKYVWELLDKRVKRDKAIKMQAAELETYDEYDI